MRAVLFDAAGSVPRGGDISILPGVVETLATLKGCGFKLGVITNTRTPGPVKRRWLDERGVRVPWDCFASSFEVGVEKPHPRIYQIALEQCSVSPAESLLFGHNTGELAGARGVGMMTAAFACPDKDGADFHIQQFADLLAIPFLRIAG